MFLVWTVKRQVLLAKPLLWLLVTVSLRCLWSGPSAAVCVALQWMLIVMWCGQEMRQDASLSSGGRPGSKLAHMLAQHALDVVVGDVMKWIHNITGC